MCVILNCKTIKPTLETLLKCEAANGHGGGVAWLEGEEVVFHKGRTAQQIHDLIQPATVRLPVVVHFRLSTVNGRDPLLTHPFVTNAAATSKLDGRAARVLFHNGHWSEWRDFCLKYAMQSRGRVPFGTWTDTRGLAWAVHHKGEGILNLIPGGKYCVLSKTGARTYGDGWTDEAGIQCSNTNWKYRSVSVIGPVSVPVPLHTQQTCFHGGCD